MKLVDYFNRYRQAKNEAERTSIKRRLLRFFPSEKKMLKAYHKYLKDRGANV